LLTNPYGALDDWIMVNVLQTNKMDAQC